LKNIQGLGQCFTNQAVVLINIGQLDKAKDLLDQAYQLFNGLGNKDGLATCKMNMGNILTLQGDYNQAIELFEQAIDLRKSCHIPTDDWQRRLDKHKQWLLTQQ